MKNSYYLLYLLFLWPLCQCANIQSSNAAWQNGHVDTPQWDATLTHKKAIDTFPAKITPEVDLDHEDQVPDEVKHLSQWPIWHKRKKQMAVWKKDYAWMQLPEKATIIDTKTFSSPHGNRTIVAWMTDLIIQMSPTDEYGCYTVTSGLCYFYGRLHFTLIDPAKKRAINSLYIYNHDEFERNDTTFYFESSEFFQYPLAIANGKYRNEMGGLIYFVNGGNKKAEGEADIMHMVDFNHDGKAYEFALFAQETCADKNSTLCGYNEKKDSLVWYTWDITWKETSQKGQDSIYTSRETWLNSAMTMRFDKDYKLNFKMDFRGRGGSMMRNYLKYDPKTDAYSGIVDFRDLSEDSNTKSSWMPEPENLK
jgi:hypothetical protein